MRRRELEDGCKKMTVNCKLLNSKLPFQYPVATELLSLEFEINKAGITPCLTESHHLLKKECHTQVTPLYSHMCCKTPLFYTGMSFEFSTFWKILTKQAYNEYFAEIVFS